MSDPQANLFPEGTLPPEEGEQKQERYRAKELQETRQSELLKKRKRQFVKHLQKLQEEYKRSVVSR